MLANDLLRVPPLRWCHIQSQLIESMAIEIQIRLKDRRDLSAGSVKIQNNMGGSRVGGHVGDLLTNLENDPIARQREGHSRSAC